ncbi:MAG: hypothetical protein ACFFDF_06900 [Candidatus Odinarchaeota archaeon]
MPGIISDPPIEYWVLQNKIQRNRTIQRIRNNIVKERGRYYNKLRDRR